MRLHAIRHPRCASLWLLPLAGLLGSCDKTRENTNLAPVIRSLTAVPAGPVIAPDTQVSLTIAFDDKDEKDPRPESYSFTWTIAALGVPTQPPGLAASLLVDDDNPAFWRAPAEAGVYRISGQICDRFNACSDSSVTLTVEQPNRAPRITATSVTRFNPLVNESITLQATAVDDDGDDLTWDWTATKGSFVSRGPGEAVWVGTETGAATITVRVTDPDNASDSESFAITVQNP